MPSHPSSSLDLQLPKPSLVPPPPDPPTQSSRGKRVAFLLIALGLGLATAAYFHERNTPTNPQAAGAAAAARKPSVRAVQVTARPFSVVLEGLGTVTPLSTVTVKSQVDGPLLSVAYQEGAQIKRGQLLAEIDPRPFKIRVAQARATENRDRALLKNAQLDLDRYVELRAKNLIAQQQLDAQRSTVDQAQATLAADEAARRDTELQLEYTRITSPIDGVAGIRQVDPGNLVKTSDTTGIVVLTQLDPIAVVFTLPQDDLPQLAAALADGKPKVSLADRAGEQWLAEGQLTVIDNQINVQTASVRLKATFANPERKLWPNQFVRARIAVSHRDAALVVPAVAIQHGPNGLYVYVLTPDDIAKMQPVQVAVLQGDEALVDSGLQGGERVVIEGQDQIKPNAPVTVRSDNAAHGNAAGHIPPNSDNPYGAAPNVSAAQSAQSAQGRP